MTITKLPQAFPRTEYMRRLAAVKSEMGRRDIDALFLTSAPNIMYLTGYNAKLPALSHCPQGLVVSIQEEDPTLILRPVDAPIAIYESSLERGNVISYPETLVGNPDKNGYDAVIDFLLEHGLANRGVGLELDSLLGGFPTLKKFETRLPKAKIVDCTKAVDWIRIVKSDLEIAIMREAAAIADAGIVRAAEVIRPGVREADAAAEVMATLIRGANGKPGTPMPDIFMPSSPRTGAGHIQWCEDVYRDGSQINLELSGVRYGYTAALFRTFVIGKPSDRLRRLHEAELAGLEAALSTIRPGASCSDVANAFNRTIAKQGFIKDSRCGYSIGVNWVEPTASLQNGDMTELKTNMTFHLNLGYFGGEDFGYGISETFRVSESGVEVLTNVPRILFEL